MTQKLMEQLDLIIEGVSKKALESYLGTALWSSNDDDDEPLDSNYDIRDIDKSSINDAKKDLAKFFKLAKDEFTQDEAKDEIQWAHDLWLTRNHHGAGFWDGDYENGDELTKIAQKFRELNAFVGDDGKVYFE